MIINLYLIFIIIIINLKTGLLIDLGDDVPPLPSKRHSVGSSVTKDGSGSRYENIEGNLPCYSVN